MPDLKRNKLFVSGLVATEADSKGKFEAPKPVDPNSAFAIPVSTGAAGIRKFRRGSVIAYPYYVYNAKAVPGGKPNLTVEVNLFADGKLLIDGQPQPADLQPQEDWSRLSDFGYMKLNASVPVGDYVLQVIVRDTIAGAKAVATQATDFQIVD